MIFIGNTEVIDKLFLSDLKQRLTHDSAVVGVYNADHLRSILPIMFKLFLKS